MTVQTKADKRLAVAWWRRVDATLRIVAAMPLGYAVASLWAMMLARLLPLFTTAATITATLIALALCAGAVMWAYATISGWRAVWTLSLAGFIAAGITWMSISGGGRL
jgi:hypothetical protein